MTRRCPWKKPRPAAMLPPPSSFVRGEHEFRIVGYSTAVDAHHSLLSGNFQVGGHTWALDCGFNKGGHLARVFLELLTPYVTQDLVVAKAGLRIEDPLGRWPAAEWQSEKAHTFVQTGGSRSWKLSLPDEFCGHENCYVQDDTLTILCTLEVLKEEDDDESTTIVANDIQKLLLLPSEPEPKSESHRRRHTCMLPDVTFVVEQTEIQAHRLVLAARSPVFAAELLGDMREGTTRRVRVDDMSASIFRAMIRFIYTDELPIKAKRNDASSGSKEKCAARRRTAMACDLLVAADRYDLEKLRLMCEGVLSESMDTASVVPTLMAVHGRHSCRRLEASCIEYLASDDADVYAAVKATYEYKELEESCNSFVVEVMNKVATRKLTASSSSSLDTATKLRQPKKMSVSTYNPSKAVSGTYKMRIPNFSSAARSHGFDGDIHSKTFQIDGYDWKLVVRPWKEKDTVKVFLELLTDPGIAGVRACFRTIGSSGESTPTRGYVETIFTRDVLSRMCEDFTAVKYADQHYLLADDGTLTVRCDIIVTNNTCVATSTTTSAGVEGTAPAPPHSIARHLEELLASEKGSDVTFLVEEREIRAHKLVIAARSPVLYEVLGAANKEDDDVVPVSDMKAAVFEAVLHFIYTGELPPMKDIALASSDGVLVVGDMLAAACRFRLDKMTAKCETLLAESISKENASSTLKLARHHGLLKLEDYCVEFISSDHVANYRAQLQREWLRKAGFSFA